MTDSDTATSNHWEAFAQRVNESMLTAIERNIDAQASLVEAWAETVEEGAEQLDEPEELAGSYARAYDIWMDTAEEQYDEILTGLETGRMDPEVLRDGWLQAANEAFKEVMSTGAFARATGRTVEEALEAQRQADRMAEETLQHLGFASRSDVTEVGERLVELERRQHAVETKLDRLLDLVEE